LLYLRSRQFQKFERLTAKRSVAFLFEQGKAFTLPALKVVWRIYDEPQFPVMVLFSVSKKNFPLSPHRNRIRRIMREAYRLHKSSIILAALAKEKNLQIGFIFLGKTLPKYAFLEQKIISALKKIQDELETGA
jgi:ribonuclease P protein component